MTGRIYSLYSSIYPSSFLNNALAIQHQMFFLISNHFNSLD